MHRYGDIDYILKSPFQNGIAMIETAREKEEETLIWQMWISQCCSPLTPKENCISFREYKNKIAPKASRSSGPRKEQTVEEQISMCKLLNAAFGGEVVET